MTWWGWVGQWRKPRLDLAQESGHVFESGGGNLVNCEESGYENVGSDFVLG
jgi:hypothetical protein